MATDESKKAAPPVDQADYNDPKYDKYGYEGGNKYPGKYTDPNYDPPAPKDGKGVTKEFEEGE